MRYRRLPGKKSGFFRKYTLYLGEDHFLSVESNIYTEEYFRFYFADIQAFISRRTGRGRTWSIILAFFALILSTCAVTTAGPASGSGSVFYEILAAVVFASLAYNLWLGQSCVTFIQTAVTVHELPALGRARRRERFLASVRPLIGNVQGRADPDRLKEIQVETVPSRGSIPGVSPPPLPGQTPGVEPASTTAYPNTGFVHMAMFAAMPIAAGIVASWVFSPSLVLLFAGVVFSVAAFALNITALVVQGHRTVGNAVRNLTWTAMIGFLVLPLVNYILIVSYMFRDLLMVRDGSLNPWSFYSTIAQSGVTEMPLLAGSILVSASFFLVVGVMGILAVSRERPTRTVPSSPGVVTGRRKSV